MALDHYVSQVYLKNFNSPKLGHLLHAIRKSDLKTFTPKSSDVCRIDEGNTNPYLQPERIIEEFLKSIEPKYNSALASVESRAIDLDTIYVIAGFISYVLTCSPAAMRINSAPYKNTVEETAKLVGSWGGIPEPLSELGGESLSELIEEGKVHSKIDPKYPQAQGISSIFNYIRSFGNFKWEILFNALEDNPFLTSDFPVAIEPTSDPRTRARVIPISPTIAVRIIPDIYLDREKFDFAFTNFSCTYKKIDRKQVLAVNRLIVQCAESLVFYRDEYDWIKKFVEKNSKFHIEPEISNLATPDGTLMITRQKVVRKGRQNR